MKTFTVNAKYCAQILDMHEYLEPLRSLLISLLDWDVVNPMKRNEILEQAPFDLDIYKEQACDAIFHYAEAILTDNILTEDEWMSMRVLKMYLKIEEDDFIRYHKEESIKNLLQEQLKRLYADGYIEKEEGVMASEMQGLFGLSATMYGEYEDEVMKTAIEKGADRIDLIRNR